MRGAAISLHESVIGSSALALAAETAVAPGCTAPPAKSTRPSARSATAGSARASGGGAASRHESRAAS
jgi:hypothetical protein